MARRVVTDGEGANSQLPFMYTVDTPVGEGAKLTKLSDILLVQLFLRHFYNLNPRLFKKLPKPPRGESRQTTAIDASVGPQTIAGIAVFQEEVIRLRGNATIVDGRVSVPTGFRVAGINHIYTIFELNHFFFNTDKQNLSFNANLEDHPTVKQSCPELQAELALQKTLRDLIAD